MNYLFWICYIQSVLTYDCDLWAISKQAKSSLETSVMWLYRRMMKIPLTVKMSNLHILKEEPWAATKGNLHESLKQILLNTNVTNHKHN